MVIKKINWIWQFGQYANDPCSMLFGSFFSISQFNSSPFIYELREPILMFFLFKFDTQNGLEFILHRMLWYWMRFFFVKIRSCCQKTPLKFNDFQKNIEHPGYCNIEHWKNPTIYNQNVFPSILKGFNHFLIQHFSLLKPKNHKELHIQL